MAEQMRALGYLCPECGKIVYGERTRFAMSAAAVGLVCGCGRSELTAQPEGASCRLTVPCGLCGGEHRAEAAAERLLEGEGIGLACPKTRQLCCYIGQPQRVERALRQLELTVEKTREDRDGAFVDSVIMYEVLSELRDFAARGGVSCACGASRSGGSGLPPVRGPAAPAGGHRRGSGPSVLPVHPDHPREEVTRPW